MKPAKSIPVEEFMTFHPEVASPGDKVTEVLVTMQGKSIRHMPVLDGGSLVGVLSERDARLATALNNTDELSVSDVMVKDPYSVKKGTTLDQVALEMSRRKIGSAVVIDDAGKVAGIFTSTDALNAVIDVVRGEV